MRTRSRFQMVLTGLLSFAVAFSLIPATPAYAQDSVRSAKFFSLTGGVTVKRGGDKELAAFEGMRLQEGDTIITAPGASAVVEIDADKTVDIDQNTEITLDALAGTAAESRTGVSVFFGSIVNTIQNKLSKGSAFDTTTSTAVMGVRGTTYMVGQTEDDVHVIVSSGTVAVDRPVAAQGETPPPTVPVENGFSYRNGGSEPVTIDRLMALSPVSAKALVNDALFASVDKKDAGVATVADLLTVLETNSARQAEAAAALAQERRVEIEQLNAAASVQDAYFDQPKNEITGEKSAKVGVTPDAPAAPSRAPVISAPTAPAAPPSSAPKQGSSSSVQASSGAAASSTPSSSSGGNDSGGGGGGGGGSTPPPSSSTPSSSEPSSSDDSSSSEPSSSDDSSSSEPSSSDDSSSSEPEPPGETVIMSTVTQDSVFVKGTDTLAYLAFSWDKVAKAERYRIEYDTGAGSFDVIETEPEFHGGVYRIFLDPGKYEGKTLRFTPVLKDETVKVKPFDIMAQAGDACENIWRQPAPADLKVSKISYTEGYLISCNKVLGSKFYDLEVTDGQTGEEIKSEFHVSGSLGGQMQWFVWKDDIPSGTTMLHVRVCALGDGFKILTSEWAETDHDIENLNTDPEPGKVTLEMPEVNVDWSEDATSATVSWDKVENAVGYSITQYFHERPKFILEQPREDGTVSVELDDPFPSALAIVALGDGGRYRTSAVKEVIITAPGNRMHHAPLHGETPPADPPLSTALPDEILPADPPLGTALPDGILPADPPLSTTLPAGTSSVAASSDGGLTDEFPSDGAADEERAEGANPAVPPPVDLIDKL